MGCDQLEFPNEPVSVFLGDLHTAHLEDNFIPMSCPDCTSGNWLPGSPKGTEENGVYIAKGSNQEHTKDKAIVVLTDIFGLAISNPKIIADAIAECTGFDVWVPDLFNGVLFTSLTLDVHPTPGSSIEYPPVAPEVPDLFTPVVLVRG